MKKEHFNLHLPLVQRTIRSIGQQWAMRQPNKKKNSVDLKPVCFCFTDDTIAKIAARIKPGASSALLIHDFGCQLVPVVLEKGITDITIALSTDDMTDSENLYNYTVSYIKNVFKQYNLKFMKVSELPGMNFDLIIANPPYGSVGANITRTIIRDVKFKQFINLLPANDYVRNEEKDLYKFAHDMEPINNGFVGMGANVTTHIAGISKQPNTITLDEFAIAQYTDPKLTKYFTAQLTRDHYAIDNATYKPKLKDFETNFDLRRCLFIGKRYISDEHIPYTKNCAGYKVNIERTITHDELIAISAKSEQANGNVGDFILAQFNTVSEQNNITNFLYSPQGFKFFAKIVVAMNLDSYAPLKKFIPKVDWTRAWTVEEILVDYGYTKEEIAEVLADLDRFKDMERD